MSASRPQPPSPDQGRLAQDARVGPYILDALLGAGGMGEVWAARHTEIADRRAAVKVVHRGASQTTEERLRREADAIARLDHPGVVRLLEAGRTSDGRPWVAMELVDGGTLADRIDAGDLERDEAVRIVRDAARGVAAAHAASILHRDIKPGNILVDRSGAVKVADFGLGLLLDRETRLTSEGALLGTLLYLSPEQANGEGATAASDVYALGATLYEAVTGRPPHESDHPAAILNAILSRDPAPPSSTLGPGGRPPPDALDALCARALAKDVAERHPSAAALADDLDALLEGRSPTVAATERPDDPNANAARAFPATALVVVATIVGVALVAGAAIAGLAASGPSGPGVGARPDPPDPIAPPTDAAEPADEPTAAPAPPPADPEAPSVEAAVAFARRFATRVLDHGEPPDEATVAAIDAEARAAISVLRAAPPDARSEASGPRLHELGAWLADDVRRLVEDGVVQLDLTRDSRQLDALHASSEWQFRLGEGVWRRGTFELEDSLVLPRAKGIRSITALAKRSRARAQIHYLVLSANGDAVGVAFGKAYSGPSAKIAAMRLGGPPRGVDVVQRPVEDGPVLLHTRFEEDGRLAGRSVGLPGERIDLEGEPAEVGRDRIAISCSQGYRIRRLEVAFRPGPPPPLPDDR